MKFLRIYIVLLLTVIAIAACSDDDEVNPTQLPQNVVKTFNEMYANVAGVEWERVGGQFKAEFYREEGATEVWIESDGTWVRTETDFHQPLPEKVQNYVQQNYSDYRIEDVDFVEIPSYAFFDLDLEKGDHYEFHLLIRADGTPLN